MAELYEISSVIDLIRGLIRDNQKSNGHDIYEYAVSTKFYLSEDYISESSLVVYVNGVLLDEDDWSYNSSDNSIVISFDTSGESLSENDLILITYSYYAKYSDNEIKGYLKSALTYFSEFQYPKTFEINSDDEVVAINGANPTNNECYFIAIITAIHIEPEDLEIRTKEFSIIRNQSKNKKEQIADAFNRFSSFIGEIEFEEDEE